MLLSILRQMLIYIRAQNKNGQDPKLTLQFIEIFLEKTMKEAKSTHAELREKGETNARQTT